MKKLMLVAALGVAGLMSANFNLQLQEENFIIKKNNVSKFENETLVKKSDKVMQKLCVVFHATCTSAYTCFEAETFNDIADEAIEWANEIQANYCMIDSPFSPD